MAAKDTDGLERPSASLSRRDPSLPRDRLDGGPERACLPERRCLKG